VGVLEILLKTVNVPQKRDVKGEKTAAVILKTIRSAPRAPGRKGDAAALKNRTHNPTLPPVETGG
jgi:hypothetical protein